MKVIIAGGREIKRAKTFPELLRLLANKEIFPENIELVTGCARGVDQFPYYLKREVADFRQTVITEFPADWDKYGRSAGHRRNKEMAEYSDVLILIWDGESRGSANMKLQMEKLKKPIYQLLVTKP